MKISIFTKKMEKFEEIYQEVLKRNEYLLDGSVKTIDVVNMGIKVGEVRGYLLEERDEDGRKIYYFVDDGGKKNRLSFNAWSLLSYSDCFLCDGNKILFDFTFDFPDESDP